MHIGKQLIAIGAATLPLLASCGIAYMLNPAPELPAPRMRNDAEIAASQGHAPVQEQRGVDGVQVVIPTPHTATVTSIQVSPDGRYVLSEDKNGTTKLWDVAGLREIRSFLGVNAEFGREGQVVLYDPQQGALLYDPGLDRQSLLKKSRWRALPAIPYSFYRTMFVSADMRVAVNIAEPTLVDNSSGWLEVTDLVKRQSFMLKSGAISDSPLALSADGSTLLSNAYFSEDQNRVYQVWDIQNRTIRQKIPQGTLRDNPVLSSDGRFLATLNKDCSIDLYELRANRKLVLSPARADCESMESAMPSIAISPDSSLFAGKSAHGIDIYELPSCRKLQTIKMEQGRGGILFSPDNRYLAQMDQLNLGMSNLSVWEVASGRQLVNRKASAIAFGHRGDIAAVASNDGSMVLQNLASGQQTALGGAGGAVTALALTADARFLLAGSSTDAAKLWDLSTGQLKRSLECPGGAAAISVDINSHTPLAVTGCKDGSAWLWDLNAVRQPRALNPPTELPAWNVAVRFSDDGQLAVVADDDRITAWGAQSGTQVQQITLPRGALPDSLRGSSAVQADSPYLRHVASLAAQPGGHLIAVNQLYQVSVWDIDTGRRTLNLDMTDNGRLDELRAGRSSRRMGQAASVWFSADGGTLITRGRRWDVASGNEIKKATEESAAAPRLSNHPSAKAYRDYMNYSRQKIEEANSAGEESIVSMAIGMVAPSQDGSVLFEAVGRTIRLVSVDTGEALETLVGGHTGDVRALTGSADGSLVVSGADDGSVRLWNVAQRREVAALIALGGTDFVTVTPDQYYRSSKGGLQGVSFRVADHLYPFEQFDLHSNRPDIILERLGRAANAEVQSYHRAYERRLKKMGFTASMLSADFHLPTVKITSPDPPATTAAKTLKLRVSAADDKFPLDRINVFVNGVPVYGTAGLPVATRNALSAEREVEVPLVPGKNMVQVSALNSQGVESLKQTVYTQSTGESGHGDVYIVAIGVSKYRDHTYDLRFAAKDAQDLIDAYTHADGKAGGHVHFLDLMNERATRDGIRAAKNWLKQSQPNDLAIVFAAGHGMMDARQDYFFGTYDIDPNQPQINGLPYEDFEALLDGIPALKKVLLIDTCFSGEVDKDIPLLAAQQSAGGDGVVKMRSFKAARGITLVPDDAHASPASQAAAASQASPATSLGDNVDYFQELFADLRRGTGAVVISSASGNEYAMEGEAWRNGVFTYALLSGLKGGKADANHDGIVTVGELQAYVIDEVRRLTAGGQNPTVRRENLDFDFAVF